MRIEKEDLWLYGALAVIFVVMVVLLCIVEPEQRALIIALFTVGFLLGR